MKKIFGIAMLLALTACATQQVTLEQQYVQSCTAYEAAFKTVNTLDKQNRLSASEIATVLKVDSIVTPLCTGKMPADLNASLTQITQATTTLTVQIIADKVSQK